MKTHESFLAKFVKLVDQHRAEQQTIRQSAGISRPHSLLRLLHWFIPNGGTLLIATILIATQSVWAHSLASPAASPGPSATTVNYQGRLANSDGSPLTGTYGMKFAIYDAATGGNLIWGPESHAAVPVTSGLFSVGLGSQTSGGIPTAVWNGDRYLEITVSNETLSPREIIRSVPIAGMALTVPDGVIGTSQIADGAVTSAKVANGAITMLKLGSNTVANRYMVEWFISAPPCTTSSTSYVDCGNVLGYAFGSTFPAVLPSMVRQYRLVVAHSNDLTSTGSAYIRIVKQANNQVVSEFDLGRQWASSGYQVIYHSEPFTFTEAVHLKLQIRQTEGGRTMYIYRVWIMAEDVVP